MGRKIKLNILGVTFSQVQAGAYTLILAEEGNDSIRIPIIIGTPEAQSIAIFLERLHPPRPLTHDLIKNMLDAMNIQLEEVYIYQYKDGIFSSSFVLKDKDDKSVSIDSRTSDAIAVALRTGSPIYIDEDVFRDVSISVDKTSFIGDDFEEDLYDEDDSSTRALLTDFSDVNYENMSLQELRRALEEAIIREDYEMAGVINQHITKKSE